MAETRSRWWDHPLCGPPPWPARFWGPESLDPAAWRELAAARDPSAEIAALLAALADATDVVDVGGGDGLLARAIAGRMPLTIVEPSAEQRAHLPAGMTALAGRAEAIPLPDRAADAAIATWVLQYCDDPLRAIDELARVARRRVAIVQAAPGNDLVAIYNREAAVAGRPPAHHGWLLAHAAERLEAAGFTVTLAHVAITAHGISGDALARLHFSGHPRRADMVDLTAPLIQSTLRDDGVLLVASR